MHLRAQELPLRYRWSGVVELAVTLAQLGVVFCLMGLFAALVIGLG